MKKWRQAEAQRCLGEVVRRAKVCGPQRVTGPDGEAVVLSARDFERLLADADSTELDLCGPDEEAAGEPVSFLELMQNSPLAEAMRTGEWPWEWDDATRDWVLPGDAVSP